jgi:hypothetical protein
VTGRLGSLLARALDWCADGVALVEVDCTVSHTNKAFASIARARDGIVTRKGAVEIADLQMRARLAAALGAMLREHDPAAGGFEPIDFQLARPSGAPAYIVSIRPLLGAMPHDAKCPVAVLFVRDLAARGAGDARMLRDLFGFTTAEASLACALQRASRIRCSRASNEKARPAGDHDFGVEHKIVGLRAQAPPRPARENRASASSRISIATPPSPGRERPGT